MALTLELIFWARKAANYTLMWHFMESFYYPCNLYWLAKNKKMPDPVKEHDEFAIMHKKWLKEMQHRLFVVKTLCLVFFFAGFAGSRFTFNYLEFVG